MAYPLIILGAGASYDSLDGTQYNLHSGDLYSFRPPLTNGIFELGRFRKFIDNYTEIPSLATYINARVPARMSFEESLSDIETNIVTTNAERYKWLIAIRYYIADLFNEISKNYSQKVNNYGYIIDRLNDYCRGDALVVNFNYDLLFEWNLPSIMESHEINSYISSGIKVIKIHGACNWSFPVHSMISPDGIAESYPYFINNAQTAHKLTIDNPRYIINPPGWNYANAGKPMQTDLYLPAVAIPIGNKTGLYVCPKEHMTYLENELKKIDRILIIGWKAGDPHLLNLIKNNLPKSTPTWIINRNSSEEEIKKRYASVPNLHINGIINSGFNQFIRDGRLDDFLLAPTA